MNRPITWILHPFVLAFYPVLLVYSRNADSVFFGETLAAMTFILAATLLGFAVTRHVWKDPARAGLFTSAILFVVFAFERNVHTLQVRGWGATADAREWLVVVLGFGLLSAWLALLRTRWFPVRAVNTMANASSVALIALLVPGLVEAVRLAHPRLASSNDRLQTAPHLAPAPVLAVSRDPDIYFIVLDAFGRSDVLKSMFAYDNEAFLERMERRGFYVARESTSNYCQTALSITASLSGNYHENLAGARTRSRLPLRNLINDNPLIHLLRSRSYQLVSMSSGFGLTDGLHADVRLAPTLNLPEFDALMLDMTPFPTLIGQGAGRASHRRHRERILHLFDYLPEVTRNSRPTFCLAHVVAPHPPFVFDSDGRDISAESSTYRLTDGVLWSSLDGHGGPDDYASHYRNQATYISQRVEDVVDSILARSPTPPVIIIQGDHGPGSHFDPDDALPNDLRERMSILNLALIPGGGQDRLYPTISAVNTFRVVADHLFGTNRGLLPDRNFYSSYQSPYVFQEVTAELADSEDQAALDPQ